MADAKAQIGLTGQFLEGTSVTTNAGADLFREGVSVGDPEVGEARARVINTAPVGDEYGMLVRVIGDIAIGTEVEIKNDEGNPIPTTGDWLTDTQLRAAPLEVTGNFAVAPSQADENVVGQWGYTSGISGTATVVGKVLQISATTGDQSATFTINGGSVVTIPPNQHMTVEPRGNLVDPTVVFVGTSSYFIEFVS